LDEKENLVIWGLFFIRTLEVGGFPASAARQIEDSTELISWNYLPSCMELRLNRLLQS